ncbi:MULTISPECIES: capsule biosynthesis protein [unclassified Campylobacter]|uniref:capsule biosynthesis protein n=1 Tax=unclassified Campylobacter TaxID=2593542 RepID=UPI001237D5B3|nr:MULTISPECIES: capsule biosynthesis protein [unclassified Campylobacter]KAA6225153.1 capsule biosynthesis protein [Campylobacter sp. LR196d]KAA6226167.1 capsule biosynthesis protein [Campylobacter sp. LR185c]KAA6228115.1 capsule biosynthesis protein [Campylobacter sp. LR286c]KAA6231368.1 capsule biosynthesis protein [Campylobacter sp. LR264d]KAA6231579.1 capsule biosynthesis protein [Campylobacter sp. LR291e]
MKYNFNDIKNLNIFDSFKIVWILMIFVVVYYVLIAANRYVSTMSLSVRSTSGEVAQNSGILSLLSTSTSTGEDIKFLQGYIQSFDMLRLLEEKIELKKLYQEQFIDLPFKIWDSSSSESYLQYFQNRVKVHTDDKTGLLVVDVEGFTPDSALLIARTIMEESEKFINEISHKAAREQMAFAEEEIFKYKERFQKAQAELIAFQNEHGTFDPLKQAEAKATLIAKLETDIAQKEAQYSTMQSYMNETAPEVVLIKAELSSLKKQLDKEYSKISSNEETSKLNELGALYQNLIIEAEFAQKAYEASLTSFESSRIEAARKIKQLVVVQSPTLPDSAKYPERLYNIITAFIVFSVCFGIFKFIKIIIEEHKY